MRHQSLQQRWQPISIWLDEHRRAIRDRVRSWWEQFDAAERSRLLAHGVGLGSVGAAVALQLMLFDLAASPYWLLLTAIAISAAYGGPPAASVAILASLLAARIVSGVSLVGGLLFCLDGLLVSLVIVRLRSRLERQHQRTAEADRWILELKSNDRHGRLVDRALSRLDEVSLESALVVLDAEGRIVDWRAAATRLYGRQRDDVVGRHASILVSPELTDGQFEQLLSEARQGSARHSGQHARSDGSRFAADMEIKPLSRGGFDGFTLIVRDLTRQQAWDAFATSATEAHARLRSEADVAQHQLATLQHLTDPALNSLENGPLVTTLLNRLRTAIDAEGVALIQSGRFERRVYCASGLQCQRGAHRPSADLRGDEPVRALMIHNDPVSVSQMSAAQWPEGVSSLIAVPVVCAGARRAVLEVVSTTRRRATEWEIALIQVVAARVAGLLRDDPYAGVGAA